MYAVNDLIVINKFSNERALLAKECAQTLGLKEIPSSLYEVGINVSELPEDVSFDAATSASMTENSLLSMGLVYCYDSVLTFVNSNGHTMVMPNSDIIKNELSNCGYLICEEGSTLPKEADNVDLNEVRTRYTLPEELAQRVTRQESGGYPDKYGDLAYDVFSENFYTGGLGADYCEKAASKLGLNTKNARLLLALHHGQPILTYPYQGVDSLDGYFARVVSQNEFLSDSKYYDQYTGKFKQLYEESKKLNVNQQKQDFLDSLPIIDEDENGNLIYEPDFTVAPDTINSMEQRPMLSINKLTVLSHFDTERLLLAKECALSLGLKEIPAVLYQYGVNISELPEDVTLEANVSSSLDENSLLSMGLVYCYDSVLTFVNSNGHTMVMPNSDIIKNELSNCGYLICEEGSTLPKEADIVNLNEARTRYTLPEELAQKVMRQESGGYPDKYGDLAYDVFSENFYTGGLGADYCEKAASKLGLNTTTGRTLLAFHHGQPSLSRPYLGIDTLDDYLSYTSHHEILFDGSYYDKFSGKFKAFAEPQKEYNNNLMRQELNDMFTTGTEKVDSNGNLVNSPISSYDFDTFSGGSSHK